MLSVYWRRPGVAGEEMQSCLEKLVATRRGESNRRCPLPPGGGWQPPGRPGAARAEIRSCLGGTGWSPWERGAADGISPPWWRLAAVRPARSSQGNMEAHVGAGGRQGRGEQPTVPIFPLEVAGSRPAGPEWPGNRCCVKWGK